MLTPHGAHGTLVTAAEQTAGRGRQGRGWSAPAGRALLLSVLLRDWPRLLQLGGASLGTAVAIEPIDNQGTREFRPPSEGWSSDWVLILDDASKNYPAPAPAKAAGH